MNKKTIKNKKASDNTEDRVIGTVDADKLFELYDKIKTEEKTKHALDCTYRFERLCINHPHIFLSLPMQTKAIMMSAIRDEKKNINSVYEKYKSLCEDFDMNVLTKKRVEDLLFELQYLYSKAEAGMIQELDVGKRIKENRDNAVREWEESEREYLKTQKTQMIKDIETVIKTYLRDGEIKALEVLGILELIKHRFSSYKDKEMRAKNDPFWQD